MKLEERISNFFSKNKFIALFVSYVDLWKDLCFLMTLIINFMIFASFKDSGK